MVPVSLRPLALALAMIMVLTTLTTAWAQSNVADEPAFLRGADDYAAGDFAGARGEWRALALKGHARSMNNVAIMYPRVRAQRRSASSRLLGGVRRAR